MSSPFPPNQSRGRGQSITNRGRGDKRLTVWDKRPVRSSEPSNNHGNKTTGRSFIGFRDGNITDPEGVPRRIFVRNIPRDTTPEDLKNFFGADKVEALFIHRSYAHVQFKKPQHVTEAITMRNGEKILNNRITVEYFDDIRPRSEKVVEALDIYNVDEDIERSRRARLGTPMRSRSNSNSPPTEETSAPSQPPPMDMPNNQHNANDKGQNGNEKLLPQDIELTLRLVIAHQTARKLSLSQLDDLLRFFSQEKDFVIKSLEALKVDYREQQENPSGERDSDEGDNLERDVDIDDLFFGPLTSG